MLNTWSVAVSWSFTITPTTLRLLTRLISRQGVGSWTDLPCAMKMITAVKHQIFFSRPCLDLDWIWFISRSLELELEAGTTKWGIYVSSANLTIRFPFVAGWRSAAVMMYDAGPRQEPCMMLAVMSATDELWPAYRVQCCRSRKKSFIPIVR